LTWHRSPSATACSSDRA
jgi:NeuD_NnaD: sugar O-acyltransferase, sialic acid O-acetyltransferase NeuD family